MNRKIANLSILIGILVSIVLTVVFIKHHQKHEKFHNFNVLASNLAGDFENDYKRKKHFLNSLIAFFNASNFVDTDEWNEFVSNTRALKAREQTGFVLFNKDASSENIFEKYKMDTPENSALVYSYPQFSQGKESHLNLNELSEEGVYFFDGMFGESTESMLLPYSKGNEHGVFYVSYPKSIYRSIASVQNLSLKIVPRYLPGDEEYVFTKKINLGGSDLVLVLSPGKHFNFGVSVLPLIAAVGFIGILILLLIVKTQTDANKTSIKLNKQLVQYQQIFEALNISTAKYSGDRFFKNLGLELGRVFNTEYSFITEIVSENKYQTVVAYRNEEEIDSVYYFKEGTPCEVVVNKKAVLYHPKGIQELYPEDKLLVEMGVHSYLGTPIISSDNRMMGLIVFLDKDPIQFNEHLSHLLKIFADRCAVEFERKKTYEEILCSKENLELAKNRAILASKAKSEFLAVMSHEIRTPLNGIVGSLNLLQETGDLSEEQQDFVNTINFSSDSLIQIINDILDFSKIEAGKMSLEKIPFSLKRVMDSVKCIFIPIADDKGLEFLAPEPSNIGNYMGDPGRIRQVIVNLVNNALKFTKEGSVIVYTKIIEEGNKARISIAVEDTGIGISQENQDKIFDSFSQEDSSTTRKFGGTGLGLAISKRLTKMMGGDLSVSSILGEGSTFTAEIVLEIAEENLHSAHESSGLVSSFQGKVLLVEDNAVNKKIATKILQKMKLEVETAENGKEAIDMCHEHEYDLVFMDIMMPVMDGLEATIELRKQGYEIPIVAMTANAFEEDKRKCLDAGMDGFITKPLKKTDIVTELDRFMNAS